MCIFQHNVMYFMAQHLREIAVMDGLAVLDVDGVTYLANKLKVQFCKSNQDLMVINVLKCYLFSF